MKRKLVPPGTGNFVEAAVSQLPRSTFFPLAGNNVESAGRSGARSTLFPLLGPAGARGVWRRYVVAFMRRRRAATPKRPAR